MVGVVGSRQEGEKEVFPSQVEFIRTLSGKINHLHLIDSNNACHKDAEGNDETSAHPPFGTGVIDFDVIMPELTKAARLSHDWWTVDLCFYPDAWTVTAQCKKALDALVEKYG
jgi:sugar phosphate isomerase/epimerase